jgi:glycine dehydrogenase
MLEAAGAPSLDRLIEETIPADIRLPAPLRLFGAESEEAYLARIRGLAARNRVFTSCIGLGYHGCVTPSVILRTVFENPGWYTPYTPYQAEIAQGRLEALLNFQTMIRDLTGMEVANASLLDEATAAAEAMAMLHRLHQKKGDAANVFLVSDTCLPQTIDVLRGRAAPAGIELRTGRFRSMEFDAGVFGALLQNPDADGNVADLRNFIARAHEAGVLVAVAADPLSLALVTPPGEMGADVVLGSAQRFGVPMGYGGPHAAFFATRERFIREMPGRIIGVSVDAHGHPAYRMALQTREQHIRRDKAKSNICTAQALLANIAGFYGVYHGPEGLRAIARRVHGLACALEAALKAAGFAQENPYFFDTLRVRLPDASGSMRDAVRRLALRARINFRYDGEAHVGIALDETTTPATAFAILAIFASAAGRKAPEADFEKAAEGAGPEYHEALVRSTPFMTHPVFHAHRSETRMMRYIKGLERKDLGLDVAMIPLGSCTMKLNPAAAMRPVTWPEFGGLHPFAPADQARGYAQVVRDIETALKRITGLAACSLQPNSGAQGELAGLLTIRAWHADRGEAHRTIAFIPASAHGTNPASAVMAGFEVVVIACDRQGRIDLGDFRAKLAEHGPRLGALMVTYPSTYGVFEEGIREICRTVHRAGGQVYMDGANLNAQVGLTSPGRIGADVCHINLHKTFSIPHGGGGPGMGPICAAKHLAPYLPGHPLAKVGGGKAIHAVAAAPWGSASILLISHAYMRLLGAKGMTEATRHAILGANYVKARLEKHYDVHYVGANGRVAHEMIFDLRQLKERSGVDEQDVAKRLMDYGFHAPTVSWPVSGTMMIEPTESEPKEELDRFCDAMIAIRGEIQAVIDGRLDRVDNPLKNAPHTAEAVAADTWAHPYTREQAAFPLPSLRSNKFWPSVGRIDNPHGDRNLVCSCPGADAYATG